MLYYYKYTLHCCFSLQHLPQQALQFELRDVAAYAEAVSGGSNVEEALLWRHIHTALERIIAPLQPGANGTPTARYGTVVMVLGVCVPAGCVDVNGREDAGVYIHIHTCALCPCVVLFVHWCIKTPNTHPTRIPCALRWYMFFASAHHPTHCRSHNPPEEFLCPISLEVMTDPVIMVETAMTYDRASIEQHFASGNDNCPLSGAF